MPEVVIADAVEALITPILLLNIVQSFELKAPLLVADAVGILKVWLLPEDDIPTSVPAVPVEKVCMDWVRPLRDMIVFPFRRFDKERMATLPVGSVVKILVLVLFEPTPENLTLPVVCNYAEGLLVPIPMLPANL